MEIWAEQEGRVWWLHVGEKRYPCARVRMNDVIDPEGRYDHRIRHAVVMVESGWEISVAWGSCTYGTNHDHGISHAEFVERPTHVEVAVLWDGPWEPCAYVTADELNDMVTQMSIWPDPSRLGPPSWVIEGWACRPAKPAGGYPDHAPSTTGVPPNGSPEE